MLMTDAKLIKQKQTELTTESNESKEAIEIEVQERKKTFDDQVKYQVV